MLVYCERETPGIDLTVPLFGLSRGPQSVAGPMMATDECVITVKHRSLSVCLWLFLLLKHACFRVRVEGQKKISIVKR